MHSTDNSRYDLSGLRVELFVVTGDDVFTQYVEDNSCGVLGQEEQVVENVVHLMFGPRTHLGQKQDYDDDVDKNLDDGSQNSDADVAVFHTIGQRPGFVLGYHRVVALFGIDAEESRAVDKRPFLPCHLLFFSILKLESIQSGSMTEMFKCEQKLFKITQVFEWREQNKYRK